VVGQGTIGGALVSQAVLDEGVSEEFTPGGEDELSFGQVPLQPCMFQDDLIHGSSELSKARVASSKIDTVMKRKCLKLNQDKSVFIVMGTKKQKETIQTELKNEPSDVWKF
jgi:hypothetical protein